MIKTNKFFKQKIWYEEDLMRVYNVKLNAKTEMKQHRKPIKIENLNNAED